MAPWIFTIIARSKFFILPVAGATLAGMATFAGDCVTQRASMCVCGFVLLIHPIFFVFASAGTYGFSRALSAAVVRVKRTDLSYAESGAAFTG